MFSILIPTSIIYLALAVSQNNLIINVAFAILFWISIWFVLNYTIPEWVVCLIVSVFLAGITQVVYQYAPAPNNHYPIRSKQRRFVRK